MVVGDIEIGTDVLVIGGGPAGYTVAVECARSEMDVTLVNNGELGGLCLHRGCIPVKTIMHALDISEECKKGAPFGVDAGNVSVKLKNVYAWKDDVIEKLESQIKCLCDRYEVQMLEGFCSFTSSNTAMVQGSRGEQRIRFKRAVIATGTRYEEIPGLPYDDKSILNQDSLIRNKDLPDEVVILGGGYGGTTIGTLAVKLGISVRIIHSGDSLFPGIDDDILCPVTKWLCENGVKIYSGDWSVEKKDDVISITINKNGNDDVIKTKKVIVATGMIGNTEKLGLENTEVKINDKGFIEVDGDFLTSDPNIYAIGDANNKPYKNASKAFREGKSLARILKGGTGFPDYQVMPLTLSSEPKISCAGMSEKQAKDAGIDILTGISCFSSNGKAVSLGKTDGFVKVIAEKGSHRILGVHIVGPAAFDIADESYLAIETGARLEDIVLTVHPHPTLCETLQGACEAALKRSDGW
ncbi:pyruvate dehydrogenase [Methanocella sp. CWC-04]|uniref:Pyruvate dehydrogenase n=1 Tax=Methanooceanicella nereidis TaxID=2052831 RepID=A0AAP2RDN4_9EURY|nr:NAD(P)/FAD-dependent oxidoreductase [Methanocella sp. CWC-04]MCD1295192.1 pyruvate dehydrogenase [Methanocella sp. CWC-04]